MIALNIFPILYNSAYQEPVPALVLENQGVYAPESINRQLMG
jgi:hypothetical protein